MAPPSAVTRATIGPRTFPSYVSLLATNQVRLLLRRSWRRKVSASPGKPGNGDLIGASSDIGALVRVIGREDVADQAAPDQLLLGDRPHVARLGDPAVERRSQLLQGLAMRGRVGEVVDLVRIDRNVVQLLGRLPGREEELLRSGERSFVVAPAPYLHGRHQV